MSSFFTFVLGGITLPVLFNFFKRSLGYNIWEVVSYKRVWDCHNEFSPGHYNEINEHEFVVKNSSPFHWVFNGAEWTSTKFKPYLIIRGEDGVVDLQNMESLEANDPSIVIDVTEFPVGSSIVFSDNTLKLTFQHADDFCEFPLVLKFKLYKNSHSLFNWFMFTFPFLRKKFGVSKIELQVPRSS